MVHSDFSGSRSGVIPSRKLRAWTLKFAHTRQCGVPTTKVNSNSIKSFSPKTNEKGKRVYNLIPNGNCGSVWPELHPTCGEKQIQRHKGLSTSSRTPFQRGSCPQLGESDHSCTSLYSFLRPMEEGLFVTWGARTLALAQARGKASGSPAMCAQGVDGGKAQVWWGRRMSVWAALTEQLTSVEVFRCQGHVPTVHRAAIPLRRGRHWWEPKDLLKASSYCKLAQRSLQSKKSLWFCIWHIYAPFLLETSMKASEWISTFKKKCPETQIHLGIKETRERQEVFMLHFHAESKHHTISFPKKRHKSIFTFKEPMLSTKHFNTSQLMTPV